jgi:tRNA(Ile)-lysidine synthase
MIRLLGQVPKKITIAVSGGADSMAALDFLKRGRNVTVLHYNHGTDYADEAESTVRDFCETHTLDLLVGRIKDYPPKGRSKEDFWREKRYAFFENLGFIANYKSIPIITCHHLDDAVETWIFSSLHGVGKIIPHHRERYLRPFLLTRKAVLEDWCDKHDVPYIIDPSNQDTQFMRNYIRHEIMPKALRVNPGIHKVIRKKIQMRFDKNED